MPKPNINQSYNWAISTCNNPKVGYSQAYRNEQTVNGITYYDCSSFINYALIRGGFDTPSFAPDNNAFFTGNMVDELLRLGFHKVQPDPDGTYTYKAGDVLLYSGHTEMVWRGGKNICYTMGAHGDNYPLPDQVSIWDSFQFPSNQIYRYGSGGAVEGGASIYVICAVLGNLKADSYINPARWEHLEESEWDSLNHGYGLGNWKNTEDSNRLKNMHDYFIQHNMDITDPEAQIRYMGIEAHWVKKGASAGFSSYDSFFASQSNDIEFLTNAFIDGWENITDGSRQERIGNAKELYEYILKHQYDDDINEWAKGNKPLTYTETLNNGVLAFRFMTNYYSPYKPDPSELDKRKHMPIWMYKRKFY